MLFSLSISPLVEIFHNLFERIKLLCYGIIFSYWNFPHFLRFFLRFSFASNCYFFGNYATFSNLWCKKFVTLKWKTFSDFQFSENQKKVGKTRKFQRGKFFNWNNCFIFPFSLLFWSLLSIHSFIYQTLFLRIFLDFSSISDFFLLQCNAIWTARLNSIFPGHFSADMSIADCTPLLVVVLSFPLFFWLEIRILLHKMEMKIVEKYYDFSSVWWKPRK